MYSASIDGTVRLWDIKEGTLLKTFTIGAPIRSMVRLAAQCFCTLGLFQVFSLRIPTESGNANAMQVVPSVGMHAFVSVAHAGGQKHGRVLSLNLATGSLEKHVYRTSAARPLTV